MLVGKAQVQRSGPDRREWWYLGLGALQQIPPTPAPWQGLPGPAPLYLPPLYGSLGVPVLPSPTHPSPHTPYTRPGLMPVPYTLPGPYGCLWDMYI